MRAQLPQPLPASGGEEEEEKEGEEEEGPAHPLQPRSRGAAPAPCGLPGSFSAARCGAGAAPGRGGSPRRCSARCPPRGAADPPPAPRLHSGQPPPPAPPAARIAALGAARAGGGPGSVAREEPLADPLPRSVEGVHHREASPPPGCPGANLSALSQIHTWLLGSR